MNPEEKPMAGCNTRFASN